MSIYQRKYRDKKSGKLVESKNWHICYFFDGKKIRESVGTNKRAAQKALESIKGEIAQDKYSLKSDTRSPKFEDYAKVYLEYSKANKRSYETDVTMFKALTAFFKGYKLSKISSFLIEKYRIERSKKVTRMSKKPIAKSTINRELATLKAFFNRAIADGKADVNPFYTKDGKLKVKLSKDVVEKERILSYDEIGKLLYECVDHLKPIVVIALNTGMRLREILYLKWNDIDFNRKIIVIIQSNSKNKKTRKIPMNSMVSEALQGIKGKSEYVFCNAETGEPYHSIKTSFGKALKRAGLEGVRFHDLRHTAATMMVTSGVDIVTVQQILGHSDIKMTARYTHPTTETKMSAVNSLEMQIRGHDSDTLAKVDTLQKVVSNSK